MNWEIFFLNYNRINVAQHTVRVLNETTPRHHTLIMFDNHSTENSIGGLIPYFDKVYHSEQNIGIAGAINKMAEMAEHDYFIYIESDCLVHKDWLIEVESNFNLAQKLVKEQSPDSAGLAWLGFKAIKPDGSMAFFYRTMDDKGHTISQPVSLNPNDLQNLGFGFVDAPCNVLSIFNKKAILDIGGANEELKHQWIDADLGLRFKRNNWRAIACGQLSFVHLAEHQNSEQDEKDYLTFLKSFGGE